MLVSVSFIFRRLCYVFWGLILINDVAIAQNSKKIAVYVTGEAEAGYKKVIGSKIVTFITKSDEYSAVERTSDFLSELAKEQEYQMSGAVIDNQIVKLGQQFGVRYVLVADVSEIFESIFISARMIDVQTGQITNSAETDAKVESLDALTILTEKVIIRLLYSDSKDDVEVIGPFDTAKSLWSLTSLREGYRIATRDEVVEYIKKQQLLGETVYLPVYVDLSFDSDILDDYYKQVYYYRSRPPQTEYETHTYIVNNIKGTIIKSTDLFTSIIASYCDDELYFMLYEDWNYPESRTTSGCRTEGLEYFGHDDIVPSGFVYLVKR